MRLFPIDKPMLWTNLACANEPPTSHTGCVAVNTALAGAPARWKNLTVLDWAYKADPPADYMQRGAARVHYTAAGYDAHAQLVLAGLQSKFS